MWWIVGGIIGALVVGGIIGALVVLVILAVKLLEIMTDIENL